MIKMIITVQLNYVIRIIKKKYNSAIKLCNKNDKNNYNSAIKLCNKNNKNNYNCAN